MILYDVAALPGLDIVTASVPSRDVLLPRGCLTGEHK